MSQSISPISGMIEMYQAGSSSTTVAKEFNTTRHKVLATLREAGIPIRNKGGKTKTYGQTWTEMFVESYQAGESILSIATRLGAGQGTVWRALNGAKVHRRQQHLRPLTITIPGDPTGIAYLAGIFDGEGSLEFRNRVKDKYIGCRLSIANTNPLLISWLLKTIGGTAHWRQPADGNLLKADWQLYRVRDIATLLATMLPYLIVKRPVAETALAYFRERVPPEHRHWETPVAE